MGEAKAENNRGFTQVAIGQLSATILGTAFWLILAIVLHPVAYGHLSWLVSIATVASTICTLGLGKTVTTFYPKENKEGLLSGSILLILITSLLGGAIVFLVLQLWVQNLLAAFSGVLVISLSLFSISFYSELARHQYNRYMWMWIGVRSISLILPLIIYVQWGLVAGILAGLSASYFIFGTWSLRQIKLNPGFDDIRGKFGFALKSLGADIGRVAINFADNILIGILFSMAILGIYQFAFRIFVLLGILPNALFFYLLPEKSSGKKKKHLEIIGVITSIALAGLVFLLAPYISSKVFPGFSEGVESIRIIGLAIVPATASRIKVTELYSMEKPNIVLGSRFLALGVGIVGIVLSFNRSLGLNGLAFSLLALQVALILSLTLVPKLLRSGEKGKLMVSAAGMVVVTALLLSSVSIHSPQIRVNGQKIRGSGLAMDTNVKITVIEKDVEKAKKAIGLAFDEIDRVEKLMSTEKESSDIYKLNHSGTDWVKLSPEVINLLKLAKDYSKRTEGRFDPTAKPLVYLWMEKTRLEGKMPNPDELSEELELVNWRSLLTDENGNRARFETEGMKVTLGGIAKGYAIDRACKTLLEQGIENALVDVGGDMRAIGPRVWTIGIQDPRKEDKILETIYLDNEAVSTSGDYRRYYFLGSKRIHHIINPKTGRPAENSMSVTIISENCMAADALSTGIFVAGPESGKKLLDLMNISGLIIDSEGNLIKTDYW